MLQWWDRIPLPASGSYEIALEEWFYRTPSHGELLAGDWAMDAQFNEHVRCIYMDPASGIAQVDCRFISPMKDRFFLFYSEERGHLVIWGGLTFRDLMALTPPGVVRKNEDLLWQPANRTRCRSLAVVPDLGDSAAPFKKSDWEPFFFHLPVVDCVDKEQQLTGQVFEVALARLEWYYRESVAAPVFAHGPLEQASFLLCATLAHAIEKREDALEYQVTRLRRERQLFEKRMEPFLGSEKGFLSLLKHNALFWARHFYCKVVAPEPEDEQALLRVMPQQTNIPILWIRIPLWEAPCPVMASEFPLHNEGFVHMPCHPPWLVTWIWESIILPEAQRNFTTGVPLQLPAGGGAFVDFFRHASLYLPQLREQERMSKRKISNPPLVVVPQVVIPIADMEDLLQVAPPCVRRTVVEQPRFPLNMERYHLTRILFGAGVSMATMVSLYERLNDQYARGQPQPLQKRFSVEGTVKAVEKKDPVWCTALINNAFRHSEGMECPLAHNLQGLPPRVERDELSMNRFAFEVKQRCTAMHTPGRPTHWKPWATPEQAMREAMKRLQQTKGK